MGTIDKTVIVYVVRDDQTTPMGVPGASGIGQARINSITPYGVKGWTGSPVWAASGTMTTTSGIIGAGGLMLSKIWVPRYCQLTQVQFYLHVKAQGPTVGQNFIGIYSIAGEKLAQTADLATELTTGNDAEVRTVSLTTTLSVIPGYYWVGLYQRSTIASPQMLIGPTTGNVDLTNLNTTGLGSRAITANTGLTTSLPQTLSSVTQVLRGVWFAVK